MSPKRTLKGIVFIVIAIILALYVLFQSQNILRGPIIDVEEPQNGSTLTYGVVNVRGKAENIAYIYLNGRQIFVDNNGRFDEKLIAPPGYSIIELTAQDKFGRKNKRILQIIVQSEGTESEEVTLPLPNATTSTSTNLNTQ